MSSSPGLAPSAQRLADQMLHLCDSDPRIRDTFKDAGRYTTAMWAYYLQQGEGVSLPALRRLCVASGLQGAGRVRAGLQYLEHVGYVRRCPSSDGALHYRTTLEFDDAWRRQMRVAVEAASTLEPQIAELLGSPAPGLWTELGRVHAEQYVQLMQLRSAPSAEGILPVFLQAYAGSQILWVLIGASADGAFPPLRAGPISISTLAKRFAVGRVQIARVLAAAQQAGLLVRIEDHTLDFTDMAREQVRGLYVVQLAEILRAAGAVWGGTGRRGEDPPAAAASH